MDSLNDPIILRMFSATACICIILSVLVIGIRVLLDGLGPDLEQMVQSLTNIATIGPGAIMAAILGSKALEKWKGPNPPPAS